MIVIEKGIAHGHVYEFQGQGDEYLNVDPSDIKVRVTVLKHPVFERVNDDLHTTLNITLKEVRSSLVRQYQVSRKT